MLTKIYLEGAMGRNFGREWTLDIHTPAEAFQLIQANIPRFGQWIRDNLKRYEKCMIICKYADGRIEALDEKTMLMHKEAQEIHFVPTVYGAGKFMGAIVGAAMVVVGAVLCAPMFGALAPAFGQALMVAGAGMLISSIVTAIMGRVKIMMTIKLLTTSTVLKTQPDKASPSPLHLDAVRLARQLSAPQLT